MRTRASAAAIVAVMVVVAFAVGAFGQTCDPENECMTGGVCVEGGCEGTPVQDGTPCQGAGPCMGAGMCVGGYCLGMPLPNDTPCKLMDACFTDGKCFFGFCMGSLPVQCPPSSNPCEMSFCNPETGQCGSFPKCFSHPCQANSCDGQGVCHPDPAPDGTACDDYDPCSVNDRCTGGMCMGLVPGETPAETPTSTPGVSGTPTRTRTSTPTTVATATATRTPTRTATMTPSATKTAVPPATATATPPPTATPTSVQPTPTTTGGAPACIGDCNGNRIVSAGELTKVISIINLCGAAAAGCASIPGTDKQCLNADRNGNGIISAGELTNIIANIIAYPTGCP